MPHSGSFLPSLPPSLSPCPISQVKAVPHDVFCPSSLCLSPGCHRGAGFQGWAAKSLGAGIGCHPQTTPSCLSILSLLQPEFVLHTKASPAMSQQHSSRRSLPHLPPSAFPGPCAGGHTPQWCPKAVLTNLLLARQLPTHSPHTALTQSPGVYCCSHLGPLPSPFSLEHPPSGPSRELLAFSREDPRVDLWLRGQALEKAWM